MLKILICIQGQHDYRLVLLAAAICGIGSLALFVLLRRSRECSPRRSSLWRSLAAVAAGFGVWATHFLAMLAYDPGITIGFNASLTVLSVVASIALFLGAIRALGDEPRKGRAAVAGVLAATGVGAMHFIGMSALLVPGMVIYDSSYVAGGFIVSAASFASAFLIFNAWQGWRQLACSAALALLAVCALHFSAMTGTALLPAGVDVAPVAALPREWLTGAIALVSFTLTAMVAVGALVDRYLTDLRGFAEATLEGIAIVRDGRIVDANPQFAGLIGVELGTLIGSRPEDWIRARDGSAVMLEHDVPREAIPVAAADTRTFEIASRRIEYRGRSAMILALQDETEKMQAVEEIAYLARHDALTGLSNRATMDAWVDDAIGDPSTSFAFFALDLDRFKTINDVFGHAAGDDVLRKTAAILKDCCPSGARMARMGGDEFAVMFPVADDPNAPLLLAASIVEQFERRMNRAMDPMAVGVSVGVAVFPRDGDDPESLRAAADIALYRAKAKGRGQFCFFDGDMDAAVRARRTIEQELRWAISRDQLRLVFQPQVDTASGRIHGYEALLRWTHPELGEVPPETFIAIAEESGSIMEIGRWVIREACRAASGWSDAVTIAVNVSPIQFHSADLVTTVGEALQENDLPPSRLEIEITESVFLDDRPFALKSLRALKDMGVRVAIDDFGTGYSSLGNLMTFPFDKIKIDRSFIAALDHDESARSIVRAILGLGRNLDLPVIAEGVETASQRSLILEEGCEQAQGYLFGRPSEDADPQSLRKHG